MYRYHPTSMDSGLGVDSTLPMPDIVYLLDHGGYRGSGWTSQGRSTAEAGDAAGGVWWVVICQQRSISIFQQCLSKQKILALGYHYSPGTFHALFLCPIPLHTTFNISSPWALSAVSVTWQLTMTSHIFKGFLGGRTVLYCTSWEPCPHPPHMATV